MPGRRYRAGPVKAIIEALISAPDPGRHREIVLYYGARRHQDLYDLPALREMELIYPWLQVIPAVSDEPAYDHDIMHGTIPNWSPRPPGPTGTSTSAVLTT